MLVERLNYLSILYVENYIVKSLYEEAIKEYAAKKLKKKKKLKVCQAVVFCYISRFFMFVVFLSLFKFLICSYFFSHSK